jgi:hypothetical protein
MPVVVAVRKAEAPNCPGEHDRADGGEFSAGGCAQKGSEGMTKTKPKPGELLRRTFTVRTDELKAAMLFASNDEARFIINSVHIEVSPSKPQPIMVATDGRRLSVIETVATQDESNPCEAPFALTLGVHFLKPLCAFAKAQALEIAFDYHPAERIIARLGKCVVDCEEGAVISGTYPDWRKVLPVGEKKRVPHIGVNAEYVGDYAKAAKLLGVDAPIISVNLIGTSDAMEVRIEARPSFYGVLMPAKVEDRGEWQPEFIGLLPEIAQEEPAVEEESA